MLISNDLSQIKPFLDLDKLVEPNTGRFDPSSSWNPNPPEALNQNAASEAFLSVNTHCRINLVVNQNE